MGNISNAFGSVLLKFQKGKEIKDKKEMGEFTKRFENVLSEISCMNQASVSAFGSVNSISFGAYGRGDFKGNLWLLTDKDEKFAKECYKIFEDFDIEKIKLEVRDYEIGSGAMLYNATLKPNMNDKCIELTIDDIYELDEFPQSCYEGDELQESLIESYLEDLWRNKDNLD